MRIIKINETDILFDYREASEIISRSINNNRTNLKVTGCCKHLRNIIITLEESHNEPNLEYIIAPLPAKSEDELIATLRSRYDSGFTTITKFEIDNTSWGLFSKASL